MKYASQTSVPVDRSKAEIERILVRYGADTFSYGSQPIEGRAYVAFRYAGMLFRIDIRLPLEKDVNKTASGRSRKASSIYPAYEQACRQRWRALALYVKATLEAIESGIIKFEEAFLPFALLPEGGIMKDWSLPRLRDAYTGTSMPKQLPGI